MDKIKIECDVNYKPEAISVRCGVEAYARLREDGGLRRDLETAISNEIKFHRSWRVAAIRPTKGGRSRTYWVRMEGYLIRFSGQRGSASVFFSYKEAYEVSVELMGIAGLLSVKIEESLDKVDRGLGYGD